MRDFCFFLFCFVWSLSFWSLNQILRPVGILKNAQMSVIFKSCNLYLALNIVLVFQKTRNSLE